MKKTITIVDYGSGNLLSAQQSFIKVVNLIGADAEIQISNNPENLKFSSHVVLPGQGAFKTCMDGIKKITGMEEQLNEFVKVKQRPFFGICVGMQVLMTNGVEGEKTQGLNFIKGSVVPLKYSKNFPIPHIGWNEVEYEGKTKIEIFNEIENKSSFYFVHSYHADIKEKIQITRSQHGKNKFVSAIKKNNIYGVQFHPEKSQIAGMKILKNFFEL